LSSKKESFEYNQALAELVSAQEIYDTTPKGLSELSDSLTVSPSKLKASRYVKGKLTRIMQIDALKEIESGRTLKLAELISTLEPSFDTEELESIIQSSRENRESFILQKANSEMENLDSHDLTISDSLVADAVQDSGESYYQYLDKIVEDLTSKGLILTEQQEGLISELNSMSPPSTVNMHAYRSIGYAIQKSKSQMSDEISRISAIQDTSPQIAAEYFDAYRTDYKDRYASLNSEEQPNPPKGWIEGENRFSGIINNPSTNFIPRDPATLYAIYKLRTDLDSIPDYLKDSSKITSVDYDELGFYTTQVSRSGKMIKKQSFSNEEDLTKSLIEDMKDSVIMMPTVPEAIYLKSKNKHRFISLSDLSDKHLDLYSGNVKVIAASLKAGDSSTLSLYSGIRKKMLKTWATKPSRATSPKLSFPVKGDSRTVKLVR
jgi:hypothetical protein